MGRGLQNIQIVKKQKINLSQQRVSKEKNITENQTILQKSH